MQGLGLGGFGLKKQGFDGISRAGETFMKTGSLAVQSWPCPGPFNGRTTAFRSWISWSRLPRPRMLCPHLSAGIGCGLATDDLSFGT